MYSFYIEYRDGRVERQTGLTKRQAVMRYNKFGKTAWWEDADRYGWSLERTV